MPIYVDNQKARDLYFQGKKIKEAWADEVQVFAATKRQLTGFEVCTSRGFYDSRDWLRGMLEEYGENYRTVVELPFKIDSSKATSFANMFQGCVNLRSVPDLDTSNGQTFANMFQGCVNLKDGNVRLIRKDGTLPLVRRDMIMASGLTREPFYDRNGRPI